MPEKAGRATRFYEPLGHEVRSDPWLLQGRSSYGLALDAFRQGRSEDAAALARMTMQEAREAYDLYALWLVELPALLAARGVPESALERQRRDCTRVRHDLERGWACYLGLIARFEEASATPDSDAPEVLELARSTWLMAHDPATDQLAALLALAADELGEASVGPLWDALLSPYYDALAEKYDPAFRSWDSSVERLALDIFEAVRGHLTGPTRDGRFDIREEAERWVLEFAPCGSGGRTYPEAESVARDPRQFTTEEHDWAWNTKGVCLYCVHCCQLQQRAPIERLGFPLRVIAPPVQASAEHPGRTVCTWSIYKDPSKYPTEAFTDVGAVPPGGGPGAD